MSGQTEGGAPGATEHDGTPVVQTPDTAADTAAAAAASYLLTAREWHASGVSMDKCAEWLVAQGDPKYADLEAAKTAISQ
jgi:hypothetical protein